MSMRQVFVALAMVAATGALVAMPSQAEVEATQDLAPAAKVTEAPQERPILPEDPGIGEMVPMLPPFCSDYEGQSCGPEGRILRCTWIPPLIQTCVCTGGTWIC